MNRHHLFLFLVLALVPAVSTAQTKEKKEKPVPTAADTARAIQIVDRYVNYVNYDRLPHDSMLYIVTHIIDHEHPNDTMIIYRWHCWPQRDRIEMWQGGQMDMGAYGDGLKIHRKFDNKRRAWRDMTLDYYFDFMMPYDIRGPLYNWRNKAGEMYYAGEYEYNGHKVDRVFVAMAGIFDRYYYFEQTTGLLFLVTEEPHVLDGLIPPVEKMVDWRSWQEFTPVGDCLMPSAESYQYHGQLVILHHQYYIKPIDERAFTEGYIPK